MAFKISDIPLVDTSAAVSTTEESSVAELTPITIPQSSAPPAAMLATLDPSPVIDEDKDYNQALGDWYRSGQDALDNAVFDPDKAFKGMNLDFEADPETAKRTLINESWMELNHDEPLAPTELQRAVQMQVASLAKFNQMANTPEELYDLIKQDAGKRKDAKQLGQDLLVAAYDDAMLPSDQAPGYSAFRQKIKTHPGYDPEREADYLEAWHETRQMAKEKVDAFREPLVQVWRAFKLDGNITAAAMDAYAQLTPEQRPEFMDALAIRAKALSKEEQATFWGNMGKVTDQAISDYGRNAAESFQSYSFTPQGPATSTTGGPVFGEVGKLIESNDQRMQAKKDFQLRRNFAADVRNVSRLDYDPLKSAFGEGKPGFWEGVAYQIPGVTTTSMSMAIPIVGAATMTFAMEGQAYEDMRGRMLRAGKTDEEATAIAEGLAPLIALPQAALEKVGFGIWSRKLPGFSKALDTLGDKITNRLLRGAVKTGAIGTAETAIELAQDSLVYSVQDIAAALSDDVPDVDWNTELPDTWAQAPEIFFTMLPLAILGAAGGLSQESRHAAFSRASTTELQALGINAEGIAAINAANGPASLATAVDTAMATRDANSEEAKAAVEVLKEQVTKQRQSRADLERLGYKAPSFTQTSEGIFVFDGDGNELGVSPDLSGAIRIASAHTGAMDNLEADQIAALGTLMEAAKAAVALDPSSTVEVNLGQFDPAQATPEMAARFAAQVALKEQAEGGTGDIARSVLGYSVTEMAQGVRNTVNRLFQGAAVTDVFHETFHGLRRQAKAAGTITRADEIAMLRALDTLFAGKMTREGTQMRFIPENMTDEQISETLLDEAFSEIAEMEILRTRKGQGKGKLGLTRGVISRNLTALAKLMPGTIGKWTAFMNAVRARWGLSLSRAIAMKKAERDGTFDKAGYDAYLDKLLGIDQQVEHDMEVKAEFDAMFGPSKAGEVAEDDIPFSIGRATVKVSNDTRIFQGAEGSPVVIGPASFSIGAYHGTPHKVDKFSLDKIGTGEGAQAYGWGMYFAQDQAVGEEYRKGLSSFVAVDGKPIHRNNKNVGTTGDPGLDDLLIANMGDLDAAIKDAQDGLEDYIPKLEALRGRVDVATTGNLYTVTLDVNDEDLLDWDKPLSEQSEKVRAALGPLIASAAKSFPMIRELESAAGVYNGYSAHRGGNKQAASEAFLAAGIPGIRYLDGNSRADGEGSYNYVIFDESKIKITEENGTPVEIGGGSFSIGRAMLKQDAAYLAAVKASDMETAQRMVDEAADKAGLVALWHGSENHPYNIFDPDKSQRGYRNETSFFAFGTPNESDAETYGPAKKYFFKLSNPLPDRLADAAIQDATEGIIKRSDGQEDTGNSWKYPAWKETPNEADEEFLEQFAQDLVPSWEFNEVLREAALEGGYDSFATWDGSGDALSFAVLDPSQIKSADPVTRDSDGNVIPLSQRFDSTKDSISFSLGPAQVAGILSDNALARITDPRRRTYVMSKISKDFNAMRLQIERISSLAGIRRSKGDLKREAMAREDLAAEEKIADIHRRFGSLLADEDLVKIKSQPVNNHLAVIREAYSFEKKMKDGTVKVVNVPRGIDPLRGRLKSKAQSMKDHPDRYQLHRGGEYDGSDGVSRSVFGGTLMPDQAAQELFDHHLIKEPTTDAMWEALLVEQKTVAKFKEMLVKAEAQIREAKLEAKQEANEWLATQSKDQEVNFSDKEEIRRALRMLDAILLALPAEIRGKIGGYTQISMIGTDEARLAYLTDKLAKADRELETFLRVEYAKEWEELLTKAAPKTNEAGQRPTGSIAADAYEVFKLAEWAMGQSFVDGEAEATKWDSIADHEDTTEEAAALASTKAQMIRLTMNWTMADAARREQAVLAGDKIYFGGLMELKIEASRRRERLGKLRDSAITGTGKTGHRMELKAAEEHAKGSRIGKLKSWGWESLSFNQVIDVIFGENSAFAKWANAMEMACSNALEDGFQAKVNGLEALFDTLAGSRFGGVQLRHRLATVNSIQVKDALGVDQAFTEAEAITFLLMYRQEDGKRHMQGIMDDSGRIISSWGWDDASAAEVQKGLSKEGLAALAFLGNSYGEEYGRINEVFRRIWNVAMPSHKMYSPLSVKSAHGKADTITDPSSGETMGAGMTPSSLKNRSFSAIAEPDFKDAFQVYLTHARQMEHFIAYGEFSRDALAIINRREARTAIASAGGPYAAKVLSGWMDYFALGGIQGVKAGGALWESLGNALGRLAPAMLVGRISVLAMQWLQTGAALFKMPTGAFLLRFAKLHTGQLNWGDAINSPYIQRRLSEMPPAVRDMMRSIAATPPNRAKYLHGQAGRSIAYADATFTAGTYAIFYDYHFKLAKDTKMANPEAYAHSEAERLTDQVAQPIRPGARSWLEISTQGDPAFRAMWNFSTDPRQKFALWLYAMMRRDKTGIEKAKNVGITGLKIWLVGGIGATVIRAIMRDMKNDDDDEVIDERHWNPKRLALMASMGPLGGIPILGGMLEDATYSATGEYMPKGGVLSGLGDAAALPRKWAKGKVEPLKDIETMATGAATVSGTAGSAASAMHLIRDSFGIVDNFTDWGD